MSKSRLIHGGVVLAAFVILLSACFSQSSKAVEPETVSTSTQALVAATASASPEPTVPPTNTPIPSPTSIPWTSKRITEENAGKIEEINRWGRGSPSRIQKLQRSKDEFLVMTDLGAYLYQTTPPAMLAFLPDADAFVLSQDERLLAVSLKNGDVQIWDMDVMSLRQTFVHSFPEDIVQKIEEEHLLPFYVGGMAFAPDNSEIAVGYADGAVELYRIGETASYATLRHDSFSLWQTDIGLVFQLSYSPDGKTLVVFKYEPYINANRLTFWSLPEGELTFVSEAGRFYKFAEPAYLPDNQTLLVFSRYDSYLYLTLWDIRRGMQLGRFDTDLVRIVSTELAADGGQITIYGTDAQENYYRQVRSLPKGDWIGNEKLDEHPDHEYLMRATDLLFEQGHYYYAWGDDDNPRHAQLGILGDQAFRVLAESHWLNFPEGTREPVNLPGDASNPYYDRQEQTIGWCTGGALHFMEKNGLITTIELPFIMGCDGVVLSPKRHYAVVWRGSSTYLVNVDTGDFNKLSFGVWRESTLLKAARFSSDEEILITSKLFLVTIWQVDPLQKLASTDYLPRGGGNNLDIIVSKDRSLAITLDASTRKESDPSQLKIWRLADALPLYSINPPLLETYRPEFVTLALSPDNKLTASGDTFGGIGIWSVKSGEQLNYFDIHALPLDLAFTPDGSGLIILLGDGTVRLWGVP